MHIKVREIAKERLYRRYGRRPRRSHRRNLVFRRLRLYPLGRRSYRSVTRARSASLLYRRKLAVLRLAGVDVRACYGARITEQC